MMEGEEIQFARPDVGEEEAAAAADVIHSRWVAGGPRLTEFEKRFADFCGMSEAVGVSSWTTGAFLVLHCWGIGPGDEVIVPSLSFIATANVVTHVGATPVFAEVDPHSWNIDPADVERQITSRTKAIIPVDQAGNPCEIDAINALADRHGLHVLQDSACALGSRFHGRPVGGLSEVSIFSMQARKIITTGEGGMILTNDRALADRLRRLRHQGMSSSDYQRRQASPTVFETYDEVGYNYRMTDVQAAIGVVQFDRLEGMLTRRREAGERYTAALIQSPLFELPNVANGLTPNWQTFWLAVRDDASITRDQVMEGLHERGIPTRRGVMVSHLEPAHAHRGVCLPISEDIGRRGLLLPMHSLLTTEQQRSILDAIAEISDETVTCTQSA
jgi:perosamine synthetase